MSSNFEKSIAAGSVVLLTGTGVSAGLTSNSPTATWVGLLKSGIDKAESVDPGLTTSGWRVVVETQLDFGARENNASMLIGAANLIAAALKSVAPRVYAEWFESTVGSLAITNEQLGEALRKIPFPILTTNYDTLLEEATARGTASWGDYAAIQRLLMGAESSIGHLHGVWSDPDSVVLTDLDYNALLAAEPLQHLQRAVGTMNSIVYVGFGAGLTDPNLGRALEWQRAVFPNSATRHFRLCLDSELQALTALHAGDNIEPVPYGARHEELASFLEQRMAPPAGITLSAAGIAINPAADAQEKMANALVSEMLVTETADDYDSIAVDDVVLPPVLLPVPNAEYVKARSRRGGRKEIQRLDPEQEVGEAECIVLVGDDESGLTTALKWMAWKAAVNLSGAAPLYVNFKSLRRRPPHPLLDAIKAAAAGAGLVVGASEELPPFVLALDDYTTYVDRISDKALSDLAEASAFITLVGCKQGHEDDVVQALTAVGQRPRVRYLGRLGAEEIRKLASYVSPGRFQRLSEGVMEVLDRENLPRTPLSVSLLLSILGSGAVVAGNSSQTKILDQYVSLLLGRGDPHEDARLGIEQVNRVTLLAHLAEHFVTTAQSSVAEDEVIVAFKQVIDRYGWKESPSLVLNNFVERRVLRRTGGNIAFGRSSYLYLFAAKRVSVSGEFKSRLMAHPLHYGAILRDHAALVRNDRELIVAVRVLLDYAAANLDGTVPYGELALVDAPSEEELAKEDADDALDPVDVGDLDEHEHEGSFEEVRDDSDHLPIFPGDNPEELPLSLRVLRALELVSTVLRDSDEVDDLDLKRQVMEEVLGTWGSVIPLLHEDTQFRNFTRSLAVELENEKVVDFADEAARVAFMKDFGIVIPAAVSLGGVQALLASRKLITVFEQALEAGDLAERMDARIGGVFFTFTVQEAGWPSQVRKLLEGADNRWIVREFLLYLFVDSFVSGKHSTGDRSDLLDLCIELLTGTQRYKSERQKTMHAEEMRRDLRRRRQIAETKEKSDALAGKSTSRPSLELR